MIQYLQDFAKPKVVDDCGSFIKLVKPVMKPSPISSKLDGAKPPLLDVYCILCAIKFINDITTCFELHSSVRSTPEPQKTTRAVVGPAFGAGVCRSLATGGTRFG